MKWILIMWVYYNSGVVVVPGHYYSLDECQKAAQSAVISNHKNTMLPKVNSDNLKFACVPARNIPTYPYGR